MNICIIGKVAPIQGGTSRETLMTAYALASLGHQVHVISNAMEVEVPHRIATIAFFDKDENAVASPLHHPNLHIHYTESDKRQMCIPFTNPHVSKLAALSIDVINKHKCNYILGYYLEPYCVSAYLASSFTGVPYFIRHAGSDIERLSNLQELKSIYQNILESSSGIVTTKRHFNTFHNKNIPTSKIFFLRTNVSLLDKSSSSRIDFNEYIQYVRSLNNPYFNHYHLKTANRKFNDSCPVIGLYGKTGEKKGHFDLIRALKQLKSQGYAFNLVALTQGPEHELANLLSLIDELDLRDECWILPYVPHWHIGAFIASCTAICFLERDFSIECHMPYVPIEVMKNQGCLILSEEIAEKQVFKSYLKDKTNILLCRPQEGASLLRALTCVLDDPAMTAKISSRYHAIYNNISPEYGAILKSVESDYKNIFFHVDNNKILSDVDKAKRYIGEIFSENSINIKFRLINVYEYMYKIPSVKIAYCYANNKTLKQVYSRVRYLLNKKLNVYLRLFNDSVYSHRYNEVTLIIKFKEYLLNALNEHPDKKKISNAINFEYDRNVLSKCTMKYDYPIAEYLESRVNLDCWSELSTEYYFDSFTALKNPKYKVKCP